MNWPGHRTSKVKWVSFAVKFDPELAEKINEYANSVDVSKSSAIRLLVNAGLDTAWGQDTVMVSAVQANAKAMAMARFHVLAYEMMNLFRDPAFKLDQKGEGEDAHS